MMLAVLFAFVGSPLMPSIQEYQVDCIEINHVFDQKGGLVLTQAILWRIEASERCGDDLSSVLSRAIDSRRHGEA
jgi:hypothetical protein